jgi:hypothetical protein
VLKAWLPALELNILPFRISSIELTFGGPLTEYTPTSDGVEAFAVFARTCSELIGRVALRESTIIYLCWIQRSPSMSDCLSDWRLDLDPIRAEVNQASERLISDLDGWLEGIQSFSMSLEHSSVDAE